MMLDKEEVAMRATKIQFKSQRSRRRYGAKVDDCLSLAESHDHIETAHHRRGRGRFPQGERGILPQGAAAISTGGVGAGGGGALAQGRSI